MIHPHPERDREAVELMLEIMSTSSYSGGGGVTLTRNVAAGVRATAGIADEAIDLIFAYLNELRNGAGGLDGLAGPFAGRPLAAQKISRMTEPPAEPSRKRQRIGVVPTATAEPGFFVLLSDRFCFHVQREHKRRTAYMYLQITRYGTQMKCGFFGPPGVVSI